jgi:hypothetical protein
MSFVAIGRLLLRDGQLGLESEGMYAWYNVNPCTAGLPGYYPPKNPPQIAGIVRRYFIGVVERYWDYAPMKIDPIDGSNLLVPNQYVKLCEQKFCTIHTM